VILGGEIGYLHFRFHNGAMSTSQCRLLLEAYKISRTIIEIIVLMGGDDNWSNGIHLNHIEANEDRPKSRGQHQCEWI